jgi:hypothetical protein
MINYIKSLLNKLFGKVAEKPATIEKTVILTDKKPYQHKMAVKTDNKPKLEVKVKDVKPSSSESKNDSKPYINSNTNSQPWQSDAILNPIHHAPLHDEEIEIAPSLHHRSDDVVIPKTFTPPVSEPVYSRQDDTPSRYEPASSRNDDYSSPSPSSSSWD